VLPDSLGASLIDVKHLAAQHSLKVTALGRVVDAVELVEQFGDLPERSELCRMAEDAVQIVRVERGKRGSRHIVIVAGLATRRPEPRSRSIPTTLRSDQM
jgi:hypothetical protein